VQLCSLYCTELDTPVGRERGLLVYICTHIHARFCPQACLPKQSAGQSCKYHGKEGDQSQACFLLKRPESLSAERNGRGVSLRQNPSPCEREHDESEEQEWICEDRDDEEDAKECQVVGAVVADVCSHSHCPVISGFVEPVFSAVTAVRKCCGAGVLLFGVPTNLFWMPRAIHHKLDELKFCLDATHDAI
jgi:hypothetical protein